MNERELRERLRAVEVPGDRDAEERAGRLLKAAWADRQPRRRKRRGWAGLALAAAALLGLVGLSSAGADFRGWIDDTIGSADAAPSLTSLPARGRLLVESRQGPWVVDDDGSQRRLGDYQEAAWSPNGLYVVATEGRRLVAMEPDGEVRWTLSSEGPVSDPNWQSPDGFRIAYRSGESLRSVAGDGTGDRLLVARTGPTPPAWRPGMTDVIALTDKRRGLLLRHADTGRMVLRAPGSYAKELVWSPDGSLLAANWGDAIALLRDRGSATNVIGAFAGDRRAVAVSSTTFSPSSRRVAYVRQARLGDSVTSSVLVAPTRRQTSSRRLLFSGPGRFTDLAWSPDGRWLLVAWKDADQWLFINLRHPERVRAVGNISSQFDPGGDGPAPFPRVSGWCCPG